MTAQPRRWSSAASTSAGTRRSSRACTAARRSAVVTARPRCALPERSVARRGLARDGTSGSRRGVAVGAEVSLLGGLGELRDEVVGLVSGEAPTGLALVEAHGPTCVTEVGVPGVLQELEELAHLTLCGGWSRCLAEGHGVSLAGG